MIVVDLILYFTYTHIIILISKMVMAVASKSLTRIGPAWQTIA